MSASPPGPVGPVGSEPAELAPAESAGQHVALDHLPAGPQAVLRALKAAGEATAPRLATELGLTVGAVRQQLAPLEDDGLVAHRDHRGGRGRPARWYCLAPAAEALFPKRYGQLANQLLDFVEASDPALVDKLFERRREQRAERAEARLSGLGFDERVPALAAILDDDGYLADAEAVRPGQWRLVERNCAILDVAQRYGHACSSELAFLRQALPGATVERVAHRLVEGHVCAYLVTSGGP